STGGYTTYLPKHNFCLYLIRIAKNIVSDIVRVIIIRLTYNLISNRTLYKKPIINVAVVWLLLATVAAYLNY
ncbi:MAG TPA: hypothetical protein PKW17_09700, partial [Smithellaceae bacterium]|nr:hypothetical protein [Smithellaceae bacterium]